jgi:DNA-binding CsgD family transcriptional regulator
VVGGRSGVGRAVGGERDQQAGAGESRSAQPAARGDWKLAGANVEASLAAVRAAGTGAGLGAAARAGAELALARGDLEGVLSAIAPARAIAQVKVPGVVDWRPLEVDALLGLGRLDDAQAALAELEAAIPACGRAEESFATARQLSRDQSMPFHLALLERDDGRRLRRTGHRKDAIARLRRARSRFAALGARPHVEACDRDLWGCGARIRPGPGPAEWNLTASELAVARLVSTGRSNREVAAELYVSVKAVEYHLGHVFDKIGIRSRKDLASRLAGHATETAAAGKR